MKCRRTSSVNPEPAATVVRHLLKSNGLGDRRIKEVTDGDKSAVAVGSGLNYVGQTVDSF